MHWQTFSEFINMGGHGFYVWGAFLVSAVFIIGENIWLKHHNKVIINQFREKLKNIDK